MPIMMLSTMPSHVHTHKQAGIMALPLDGRFQLKTSYARFPPTNQQHPCTYQSMNSAPDMVFGFGQSSFIYMLLERTFGNFKLARSSNGNGTNLDGSYTLVSNA
jgi:hypothetical protein